MRKIVDTSVIVRYLVGDVPEQRRQAKVWFRQAEGGELDLRLLPLVVAEVAFVLESFYKIDRIQITDWLTVFLSQRWLKVDSRAVLLSCFDNYKSGLHFVDSYLLAFSKADGDQILTFDQQLDRKALLALGGE